MRLTASLTALLALWLGATVTALVGGGKPPARADKPGLWHSPETATGRTGPIPPVRPVAPHVSRSRAPRAHLAPAHPAHGGSVVLTVTAYTWTGQRTASGKWPALGMAASNDFPFGTRLHVKGFGIVTVEDRIGHGTQLDIYLPTERQCVAFGRRHLLVEVLRG